MSDPVEAGRSRRASSRVASGLFASGLFASGLFASGLFASGRASCVAAAMGNGAGVAGSRYLASTR
jgi:hypothetical protein